MLTKQLEPLFVDRSSKTSQGKWDLFSGSGSLSPVSSVELCRLNWYGRDKILADFDQIDEERSNVGKVIGELKAIETPGKIE